MSDIVINVDTSDNARTRSQSGNGNDKHKRFLRKRRQLERRGYLKAKQNQCNHRKRQSKQECSHHEQMPRRNGAKHPPSTTDANSRSPPHAPSTASAAQSASTSSASFTIRKGNIKSEAGTTGPSVPSSHTSAAVPSNSAVVGIPTKYLAIDCEMVGTGRKGSISQLARCSIVSYAGEVMYDKFIKPSMPVTDYRTRWSGIRSCDLVKATPYLDARKEILRILMGKVVIGHAINNDFKALGYFHPAVLTRDTSRIPLLNQRAGFSPVECASLKRLTKAIFNRDIQTGERGHSSVEDARATMELYKVVEVEWERKLASSSQAS